MRTKRALESTSSKEDDMIRIFELNTGKLLCRVGSDTLAFLQRHLEEEGLRDVDYYLDERSIEYLRQFEGAPEELLDILLDITRTQGFVDIAYDMEPADKPYEVRGRIVDKSGRPISCLKVELLERDLLADDFLGWCFTSEDGEFRMTYSDEDFKEEFMGIDLEKQPELTLRVSRWNGQEFEEVLRIERRHKVKSIEDLGTMILV
jgi:acetolactate synthase regulatory subunit